MKKETFKLDWKWIVMIILLLLLFWVGWSNKLLTEDVSFYKDQASSLSSNLNGASGELDSYLLTHDCYERGSVKCYDKESYCYDTPKITSSCSPGYEMACVPN